MALTAAGVQDAVEDQAAGVVRGYGESDKTTGVFGKRDLGAQQPWLDAIGQALYQHFHVDATAAAKLVNHTGDTALKAGATSLPVTGAEVDIARSTLVLGDWDAGTGFVGSLKASFLSCVPADAVDRYRGLCESLVGFVDNMIVDMTASATFAYAATGAVSADAVLAPLGVAGSFDVGTSGSLALRFSQALSANVAGFDPELFGGVCQALASGIVGYVNANVVLSADAAAANADTGGSPVTATGDLQ